MVKKISNKKGWIKIVEVFISILLVIGILLTVIHTGKFKGFSENKLEEKSFQILKEISLNNTLRERVVEQVEVPVNSNDNEFPIELKNYIESKIEIESYCVLQICEKQSECSFEDEENNNAVSSKEILIFCTNDLYSPKKLKVFCYKNDD